MARAGVRSKSGTVVTPRTRSQEGSLVPTKARWGDVSWETAQWEVCGPSGTEHRPSLGSCRGGSWKGSVGITAGPHPRAVSRDRAVGPWCRGALGDGEVRRWLGRSFGGEK